MRLYHLTNHPLTPGTRLQPQASGNSHRPENRALETVLERYRPQACLARRASVFLTQTSQPARDLGASGDRLIALCEVVDLAASQRSDMNWLRELDQGFEDPADLDLDEHRLAYLARGYWSGVPRPGMRPNYEYRATSAIVLSCRPRSAPALAREASDFQP